MSNQKTRKRIKEIETIVGSNPRTARLLILRLIGELTQSSRGLCYCLVTHQGKPYSTEPVGFGPPDFMEAIQAVEGQCLEDMGEREDGTRAEPLTEDPYWHENLKITDAEDGKDLALYRVFFQPNRIRWILASFVSVKGIAKGWIGVYRTVDEPCFSRRDLDRFRPYYDELFPLLVETMDAGRWKVPPNGMIGMMDSNGEVIQASSDSADWFKDGNVCGEIKSAVRDFLQGEEDQRRQFVRRHAVELQRMVGDGNHEAHVRITPTEFLKIPVMATLTPRQRGVAKLLLSGATLKEVSSELNISTETVRSHVKSIYDQLGVANRIEFAEAVRDD